MTTKTRPRDPRASGGGSLLFPLTESGQASRGEAGAKKRPEGRGHSPSRSHRIRCGPSNLAVASPRVSRDISAAEPVSAVRRACRTKRGRYVEAAALLVPRGADLAAAQALSPLWGDNWNEALCLCPTGLSLTSDPIPHSREASRFLYEGLPCGLNCILPVRVRRWSLPPCHSPHLGDSTGGERALLRTPGGRRRAPLRLLSLPPTPAGTPLPAQSLRQSPSAPVVACTGHATSSRDGEEHESSGDFTPRLVLTAPSAHLGLGSSLSSSRKCPALRRSRGVHGFRFSFIL